jgi:RNase H-like domain found in reverse transcriptase/Reverse transcriptase (RNA-dependent DNA polymerase)
MHNVFHKLLDRCVVVYLDDILVYSQSLDEHKQHLKSVMQLLRQHKFYAKLKKCSFYRNKVTFLGHDIDNDGMHINDNKIKAVKEWPTPRTKRDVQRFVGFAQFFRQFIYKFSAIALPLTSLCGSNVTFEWTTTADNAFKELRTKLCEAPVLHIFDTTLPIEVHTDASETALSGILY